MVAATAFLESVGEMASGVRGLDFSDGRQWISRSIRSTALALRTARRPAALTALAQLSAPENQRRMVFVVGAGRSGTTAMQVALNASPDVFVFGEACLFWENLRPDFRARYDEKHQRLGHAPNKGNVCPAVAPDGATWAETLAALLTRYRFMGDKIPFGAYRTHRWPSAFLDFHSRYFRGSTYLLSLRNPRDAILSVRSTFGHRDLVPWTRSYIASQRALIRLRVNFPRTVPVVLESVGRDTFQAIEESLECGLPALATIVAPQQPSPLDSERVPVELRPTMDELQSLYSALCDAICTHQPSSSLATLDAIDARLAGAYHGLDPLYYSIESRLSRLRSRAISTSRAAKRFWQRHAHG